MVAVPCVSPALLRLFSLWAVLTFVHSFYQPQPAWISRMTWIATAPDSSSKEPRRPLGVSKLPHSENSNLALKHNVAHRITRASVELPTAFVSAGGLPANKRWAEWYECHDALSGRQETTFASQPPQPPS
ncbi:unnamed protein product [Peniophora sp. CBMAI 1063]|nr:unnamed protein product [Peniophora sp. CBMAI 1063]